jgi:uncharacterized membrane protein YfcA
LCRIFSDVPATRAEDIMDLLTGSNDLGTLGLGLLIAGAAAGLFSGVLGRGAGLILVPALYLALSAAGVAAELRLHLAMGTTLACLLPLALAGLAAELRSVDWKLAKAVIGPLVIGVVSGAAYAAWASSPTLALIFAAVALTTAALTVLVKDKRSGTAPRGIAAAGLAFGYGAVASAMGLGGGAFGVPVLMLCRMSRARASAMAALFATIIAGVGALAAVLFGWDAHGLPKYSFGYVNLLAFGIIAPVAFATAAIGRHYAEALEAKRLHLLFAGFVVLSTAKMVWDVVG